MVASCNAFSWQQCTNIRSSLKAQRNQEMQMLQKISLIFKTLHTCLELLKTKNRSSVMLHKNSLDFCKSIIREILYVYLCNFSICNIQVRLLLLLLFILARDSKSYFRDCLNDNISKKWRWWIAWLSDDDVTFHHFYFHYRLDFLLIFWLRGFKNFKQMKALQIS